MKFIEASIEELGIEFKASEYDLFYNLCVRIFMAGYNSGVVIASKNLLEHVANKTEQDEEDESI